MSTTSLHCCTTITKQKTNEGNEQKVIKMYKKTIKKVRHCEFANVPSKFDTCLQGNLQVEILMKSLETRQQRYNSLVFATGPGSLV